MYGFDFGNANKAQQEAISTIDGPLLITAGPGTGKTFTLVQRAIYLIQEHGVAPEQIFIATFTEKAAKELVTRITNELVTRNISVNVNEMYVGTFHSLCLRIIKDHLEYSRLKKNYRMLDDFDQKYTVFRNINLFRSINDFNLIITQKGTWKQAKTICDYVNKLSEEMVDAEALIKDPNRSIAAMGNLLQTYKNLLMEQNLLDFATIQTECFRMLTETPSILEELQEKLHFLMIDEYQDTNYIQEQIVFLLGKKNNNICVVGDDDQGLYRFRGATIRNILEFPEKFSCPCKKVALTVNYRSNKDIVDFYNKWMSETESDKFSFDWGKFRYEKNIEPNRPALSTKAVARLSSNDDENKWHENVLGFINKLKSSGKLKDYNQLAFLFNSVKNEKVIALANYLEEHGISVYSPRSNMFFERKEIRLVIGCLMIMFPLYVQGLERKEYKYLTDEQYKYYMGCIKEALVLLAKPENDLLRRSIKAFGINHMVLEKTTDYAYSGLLYRLFQYPPFSNMLDTDMGVGVVDIRPTRNLAQFTQFVGKFEYLHNVAVLSGTYIKRDTENLFNLYMRLLYEGGISEYEDDSEYAPSGCVSFLTIHQSKGMEFPVVFVGSLGNTPRKSDNELLDEIERKYFHRPAFEPRDRIKYFDFWRLFYTAFSRAQDLLVLTCNESKRIPSNYFAGVYPWLMDVNSEDYSIDCFDFQSVKKVNLKETFSFTSHITVYETCPLQYKFYKELEFMPVRNNAMLFGTLVHETIEDIHKAALRNEEHLIKEDNISKWFDGNYHSLVKSTHSYLSKQQLDAALGQVLRYADRQKDKWHLIKQAEVDVSLVKPDYIIEGKIDLIQGKGDTVEIVDFKSEKKPDMELDRERLEHYRRQLQIYAYLVEQRTGQKVSKMHLYYTGEDDGNPRISYPNTRTAIEGTMAAFDDTVRRILAKDFRHGCHEAKTCRNCDLRYYCKEKA